MERTVFILAGHHAGKAINLNGHQFLNGICEIFCPADVVPFVKRSLGRYQAYPERSLELELAQKRDSDNGIRNNLEARSGSRQPETIRSVHESPSGGLTDETSDDGGSDDEPSDWNPRTLPEGSGHEDTGDAEFTPEIDYRLKEIVESLDPKETEHWTDEGLPSIEAVMSAYGPNVTREDITVSGEGWTRKEAFEKSLGKEEAAPVKRGRGRPKKTKEVAG